MVQAGNHVVADYFDFGSECFESFDNSLDVTRCATGLSSGSRRGTKIDNSQVTSIRSRATLIPGSCYLLFEFLQFTTRLGHVVCDCECFLAQPGGRAEQHIRARSPQQAAMRINHDHFASACECAEDHEQVLTSLPRKSLSRDG